MGLCYMDEVDEKGLKEGVFEGKVRGDEGKI